MQLDDRDLLRLSPAELARTVTYMPQALPQGVALTVIEAVITALCALPTDGRGTDADLYVRAEAVLDRLDIRDLALAPLDELSGGQRQLASLAQAIVGRPAVLLLDEPTGALDPRHQIDVMSAIREIAVADNMVVLLVLHDLNLALRWSDNVVLLNDGALAAAGRPQDAVTPDTLAATFRVDARIEKCSRGQLHVLFDGAKEPHVQKPPTRANTAANSREQTPLPDDEIARRVARGRGAA